MRGVMEFDDFNYVPFNNMILLPEPLAASPTQAQHHAADDKSVALSIKTIDRYIEDDDYHHEAISLPLTPEQLELRRLEKEEIEKVKKQKR